MRKVLYITNIPAPYRVEFFNELSKRCKLTVAFEMSAAKDRNKDWKSEEPYHFQPVFMKGIYQQIEGAFCPEVIRLIKKYKKEIIVVGGYSTPTGMYSILYLKLHHIPFWLNCDGGMIKDDNFLKKKIKQFFIGSANAWLSTGKIPDEYLVYYGARQKDIYRYYFTSVKQSDMMETPYKDKAELKKKLGINEEKVVLFVGSFIHRKGVDILLRAVRKMDNTAIVLVGGNDLSKYQKILDSGMKSNIYVIGFKNKEDVKSYYHAADVFVLPTREDIWGLVVNEAMAAGLPVITTDRCVSGMELIEDGINGYIVPVDNVRKLSERIRTVLSDKGLREQMSRNNIEKIKEYTIEKMAEQHAEALGV